MRTVVLAVLLAGCATEPQLCRTDDDCPSGFHCITGTGVCERMRVPDAAVPDLGALDEGTD
jgi:Cys-rich repeat protein